MRNAVFVLLAAGAILAAWQADPAPRTSRLAAAPAAAQASRGL